jgi:uncharacterized glyoxalase superfamily protein PhnB
MAGITPAIRVRDMGVALTFYRDTLGFTLVREATPEHNSLERGDSRLMLEKPSAFYGTAYTAAIAARTGAGTLALYIEAPDLDELYARVTASDAKVIDPLGPRDWGQREFTVEDPDGTWLSFWKALDA